MSGLFNDDTLSLYLRLKEAMKQYVRDAMPGGALNREIKPQDTLDAAALSLSPVPLVGDAAGLLADGYRYATDPSSRTPLNYGLSALGALPFVPAMGAVTAWHGSPHKFDKFDLSKIGTGEGAQAYGHGSYLAETREVAKGYAVKLSNVDSSGYANAQLNAQNLLQRFGNDKDWAKEVVKDQLNAIDKADPNFSRLTATLDVLDGKAPKQLGSTGYLYKTDIPDEAVARFLDWDKPLSEQAPEVQAALGDLALKNQAHIGGVPIRQFIYDKTKQTGSLPSVVIREIEKAGSLNAAIPALQRKFSGANDAAKNKFNEILSILNKQQISMHTGVDSVRTGGDIVRGGYNPPEIAQMLQSKGIPGIRYLDGGSRGAGTGTSNFVVFDPEMIRILERNGEATGAKPWQPGEWEGLFKK